MRIGGAARLVAALCALSLLGCDRFSASDDDRPEAARDFPRADRPVAQTISTRWSTEEARDKINEAQAIMDLAGVKPGMTVADIGAGEGYYTVRLSERVGPRGRVLGEDILAEVIDALGRRVTREKLGNVSVKLGTPEDPKLPVASFDRVFMIHMYHEIAEPYAFLWHLYPALKPKGQVIVFETNRPIEGHGTPPELLRCEFAAVGYVLLGIIERPEVGGYLARFTQGSGKPASPGSIVPCAIHRPATKPGTGTGTDD